jgi:hypothetical protein
MNPASTFKSAWIRTIQEARPNKVQNGKQFALAWLFLREKCFQSGRMAKPLHDKDKRPDFTKLSLFLLAFALARRQYFSN